ncbi:MAG TPA: nitrite reductase small subunit NirD [Steroidobacteraceae bacterium]|nr:nitrite reductase small subunit NirD [Steroidobacteraceae bacterium]
MNAAVQLRSEWKLICAFDDITPQTGVCALVDGKQIAIFRYDDMAFAVDNYDPASEANVISRGLVGDIGGDPVVASPIYKHHYSLVTGRCLEDPDNSIAAYPVRIIEGKVWLQSTPLKKAGRRKLVVIGNGMAGMRTVEELLQLAPNAYDITVISAEPHANYNRILLSPVLSGEKTVADIIINPLSWYDEKGIKLYRDDPAASIDRKRRMVKTRSGLSIPYDRLLLATGSNPIILPVPGNKLEGVVTFRDLHDVERMLTASKKYKRAVVIGGGLLGLEAAYGLKRRGMEVTVVHLLNTLMERQLDKTAAELLKASLEKRGLNFKMNAKTTEIVGDERVSAVRFDDGSELHADLVVMAAGIRPNIELAKEAGLRCERGVVVDDDMLTYDPGIYAVGECVQHRGLTYGLVAPLWEQARICAIHLAEKGMAYYRGSLTSTQLKVTGIDVFSAGNFIGGPNSEALVMKDARRGIYKRVVIENNIVIGAVLYGDTKDGPFYFDLMNERRDVGSMRDRLLFGAAMAESA